MSSSPESSDRGQRIRDLIAQGKWDTIIASDSKEGVKHDQEKPRMDLIPPDALVALAEVLTKGAKKYGDDNWLNGMDWGRVYSALQRHLNAFWAGEDADPEWGLSHLAHAMANICFLLTYQKRNLGNDPRRRTKNR